MKPKGLGNFLSVSWLRNDGAKVQIQVVSFLSLKRTLSNISWEPSPNMTSAKLCFFYLFNIGSIHESWTTQESEKHVYFKASFCALLRYLRCSCRTETQVCSTERLLLSIWSSLPDPSPSWFPKQCFLSQLETFSHAVAGDLRPHWFPSTLFSDRESVSLLSPSAGPPSGQLPSLDWVFEEGR